MSPRRDPPRGRRAPVLTGRRRILIVCGAEKTESAYFKGLRDAQRLATMSVAVIEKGQASPDEVVRHAKRRAEGEDYDEVWCIVDVDRFEREGGKISEAVRLAEAAGIKVAVSNPCFELWLLLHREQCTAHCADCGVAERLLKRRLPAYDKTRLRFADFAGGVQVAVERAERLEPTGREHTVNPSSGVWPLVKMILEQT
ncbi:RloB family protein [Actinoplanes sp. NPDC051851]|uniref:RloB family protein n=1 Tax=Actinoplanes sp. NPDC051851 TaxID=3154753 RepID=UPI00341AEDBC